MTTPGGCTATAQTVVVLKADINQTQRTIRIKSVDATPGVDSPTETDLLPRINGGLGTLNLSVEELDGESTPGQSLAGYTYRWFEPTSTSAVATTATSTTLTGRRIGTYKVTLINGTDTLVAYTTLRAKPCRTVAHTYRCGGAATPIQQAGGIGLSSLAPGDTIRTGDFDLIVTEVQGGSNGVWTGIGYTEIPYLKGTRIAVEFKNARVNDCYEYTGGGTVQSAYDPSYFGARMATENIGNQFEQLKRLLTEVIDLLTQANNSTSRARLAEVLNQIESIRNEIDGNTFLSDSLKQVAVNNINNLLSCAKPASSTNASRGRSTALANDCNSIDEAKTLQDFVSSEAALAEAFADFLASFDDPLTKKIVKVTYSAKTLNSLYLKFDKAGNPISVAQKSSAAAKTSVLLPKALRIAASTPVQVVLAVLTSTPAGADAEIKFIQDQQARTNIQYDQVVPDFTQTQSEVDIEPEPGKVPATNLDVEDDGKKYLVYICRRNFKCKANFTGVTHCLKYVGISTIDPADVIGPRGRYRLGDIQADEFVKIFEGLKKGEARGVEQAIIDLNSPGLETPYRSTRIDNLINSTARYRKDFFGPRLDAGQRKLNAQYPNWRNPYVKQLPVERYRAGGMKFSGNEYSTEPNCCVEP